MLEIHAEDVCNDTYGRVRMFQAITLKRPDGIPIPSERTVYRVMEKIGLSHRPKRNPKELRKQTVRLVNRMIAPYDCVEKDVYKRQAGNPVAAGKSGLDPADCPALEVSHHRPGVPEASGTGPPP